MKSTIRLALVEDDPGLLDAIHQVFDSAEDFQVVGTATSGEQALENFPAVKPEVVLMDIHLPGISGIECLRLLKARLPGVRVIMVTVYDDNDMLFESLKAGADGYLLKRTSRVRLLEGVREIAAGGAPISPRMARRMVEYFHRFEDPAPPPGPQPSSRTAPNAGALEGLTARERQVLGKLAEGLAPKEVATELNISWETVRQHTTSIYSKLHVHSRSEAILMYLGREPAKNG